MTMFHVYAIAAPINAFLFCAFITYFLKNFKMRSNVRMTVTYLVYVLLAFVQCAGGNGIFGIDMSVFNLTQFLMFITAGACVCIGIYFFYERGNIGQKIEDRRKGKK
ncbi:MAG: hypothetical protein II977_01915 [Oscillospiraceae bacterium]|nr:hypothetical protein [Oscillospiraceae bacterium]